MKLTFNSDNPNECHAALTMLCYLTGANLDGMQLNTPLSRGELADPLASAGAPPPPPPPGAPEIEPDLTEQNAEATAPDPAAAGHYDPPVADVTPLATEVDAAGIPWDARIHSSGKTQKKDNSWVRKRGVDDAVYQQVVAEITAGVAVPDATPPPGAVPPPPGNTADDAGAPPPPPAEPGFAGGDAAVKWQGIVQKVMSAKVAELITQDELDAHAASLGVTGGFLNMVSRPDLFDDMTMFLMSKGV